MRAMHRSSELAAASELHSEKAVFWYVLLLAVLLAFSGPGWTQSMGVMPAASPAPNTTLIPPDTDQYVPPVKHDMACPLDDVLRGAAQRVQELVVNLQDFSATELLEYGRIDEAGRLNRKLASFSYVASIREVRPGQLAVEEYRNDSLSVLNQLPKPATLGTVAHALIFHPNYIEDFEVHCEGLAAWQGPPAWQVRFAHRAERRKDFRAYIVAHRYFPVRLKGRAWIAADSYRVLRLETDLLAPIPEIPLVREHISISYRNVDFPRRGVQLWLPEVADIYMHMRGRQYHRRHSFSDFKLFWVDTDEQVKLPLGN